MPILMDDRLERHGFEAQPLNAAIGRPHRNPTRAFDRPPLALVDVARDPKLRAGQFIAQAPQSHHEDELIEISRLTIEQRRYLHDRTRSIHDTPFKAGLTA